MPSDSNYDGPLAVETNVRCAEIPEMRRVYTMHCFHLRINQIIKQTNKQANKERNKETIETNTPIWKIFWSNSWRVRPHKAQITLGIVSRFDLSVFVRYVGDNMFSTGSSYLQKLWFTFNFLQGVPKQRVSQSENSPGFHWQGLTYVIDINIEIPEIHDQRPTSYENGVTRAIEQRSSLKSNGERQWRTSFPTSQSSYLFVTNALWHLIGLEAHDGAWEQPECELKRPYENMPKFEEKKTNIWRNKRHREKTKNE